MNPSPQGEGVIQIDLTNQDYSTIQSSTTDLRYELDKDMDTLTEQGIMNSTERPAGDNTQQKRDKVFNLNNIHIYGELFYAYLESTDDKNVGRLHPMYIGHILLKKLKINNITSISSLGKNRIKVTMKSAFDINNLVRNIQLEAEHLKAYIPSHLTERKGLLRGIDTRFDENYIKDNMETNSSVLGVKRMHRKITIDGSEKFIPRQMVIVTFEGSFLPNNVTINSVSFNVEPFVGRVVQCFKCLRFGHVSKQCKSTKTLCIKCSKEKTDEHFCENNSYF